MWSCCVNGGPARTTSGPSLAPWQDYGSKMGIHRHGANGEAERFFFAVPVARPKSVMDSAEKKKTTALRTDLGTAGGLYDASINNKVPPRGFGEGFIPVIVILVILKPKAYLRFFFVPVFMSARSASLKRLSRY